jgi:hypothetical protein
VTFVHVLPPDEFVAGRLGPAIDALALVAVSVARLTLIAVV